MICFLPLNRFVLSTVYAYSVLCWDKVYGQIVVVGFEHQVICLQIFFTELGGKHWVYIAIYVYISVWVKKKLYS